MMSLNKKHLIDPLNEAVMSKQIPILGICLGMQIMSSRSEEGRLEGLSWIPSSVIRINSEARKDDLPSKSIITKPQSLIVPHIGWSKVKIKRNNLLFNNMRLFEDPRYYFVHSYYVKCKFTKHVIATIDYGNEMCCAFNSDNIFGVQFHPEKSHKYGMNLLRQFYNA
jgi:glutamine amidotransferase